MELFQVLINIDKHVNEARIAYNVGQYERAKDELSVLSGMIVREIMEMADAAETPESEKSERSEAPPSEADVVIDAKAFTDEKLRTTGHCVPDELVGKDG